MLYRDICKVLGIYLFAFTSLLTLPFLLALYYEFYALPSEHPQPHATQAFLEAIVCGIGVSGFFYFLGRKAEGTLYRKEGILVVVLIWFLSPAIGALPFSFSHTFHNPFHSYFEAVSGLTTTGLSAMQAKAYNERGEEIPVHQLIPGQNSGQKKTSYEYYGTISPVRDPTTDHILFEGIEAVSKALLFWRSFIQWIGGVGVVVLFLAILPVLGIGGKVLYQNEIPGPVKEGLTPRIKETALKILQIYIGLTLLEFFLLLETNVNMPWLDALTISFSTLGTGGFGIHNTNIAFYQNVSTEMVVMLFMFLSGINFALYGYIFSGRMYRLYDRELFLYTLLTVLISGATAWFLLDQVGGALIGSEKLLNSVESLRYGAFQVVSMFTSTGFVTANYDVWPAFTQTLLIIVMYIGAMSGSSAGGIKTIRIYMLFRVVKNKVEHLFRPHCVKSFRLGEKAVDGEAATMVLCFFVLIIGVSLVGTSLYILDGVDLFTAFGLVCCNVNNIGAAFGAAGPTQSVAFLSNFSLMVSSLLMILGRLEFFAVLALLIPAFWKQDS